MKYMAEAFHGPKLLFHVDHINGERDDNRSQYYTKSTMFSKLRTYVNYPW